MWYNVFMKGNVKTKGSCPTAKAAALLSDIWTMLIVRDLLRGERRFCDLERSLEGISTRTLTLKLRTLEKEGIIQKAKSGAYSATKKGTALEDIQKAMERYGKRYL